MTTLTLETYTFGLSRSTGKMRFRHEDGDTLVDRIAGQWMALGTNRDGNILAECALEVREDARGKVAYVYHPDIDQVEVGEAPDHCDLSAPDNTHDTCHIATENAFPQGRDTHWRLCYARELAVTTDQPCWRLRDERTDELWFVQDYAGPMNVNWFDRGTHIFCDGPVWVDENLVAHFGEPA